MPSITNCTDIAAKANPISRVSMFRPVGPKTDLPPGF